MTTARVIAIDGPAASGKTTLAQLLAERLGYLFFDTGVMYRAVTLAALTQGVSPDDEKAVSALADSILVDVRPATIDDGRQNDVISNGEDVTWAIRSVDVDRHVSRISAYAGVRRAMTRRQREIGLRGRVVMVGRDIGTVVLPEAELKIYLDATVEERARRRQQELTRRDKPATYDEVLRDMAARDSYDSTRPLAPLRPAADAVRLDTTGLTVEQVLARAMSLVES